MKSIPDETKLKKIWAEVPPDYYFQLNYFQKLWHEWKWLVFRHLLTPDKPPRTILEIGCSGGHLSALLADLFPDAKVVGIDVYEAAVVEAKKRFPKLFFKVADAHQLPFRDKSFDLVVMSETIEHVVDPRQVLQEISRVLSVEGRALVEMDSGSLLFRTVWYFWTKFGRGHVWSEAHLHPFSAKELERLIKKSGFTIQKKIFSHFGMAVSFLLTNSAKHN